MLHFRLGLLQCSRCSSFFSLPSKTILCGHIMSLKVRLSKVGVSWIPLEQDGHDPTFIDWDCKSFRAIQTLTPPTDHQGLKAPGKIRVEHTTLVMRLIYLTIQRLLNIPLDPHSWWKICSYSHLHSKRYSIDSIPPNIWLERWVDPILDHGF